MTTVLDRIKELTHVDLEDIDVLEMEVFEYSLNGTYEKFEFKRKGGGLISYAGAYHPEGCCEGGGVCKWCGRTLAFD